MAPDRPGGPWRQADNAARQRLAGAVIAMIPCVLLFVALQRFYVSGFSAGAMKG